MVGFVFSLIFLIAGIAAIIVFSLKSEVIEKTYKVTSNGRYALDENGNWIVDVPEHKEYPLRKFIWIVAAGTLGLMLLTGTWGFFANVNTGNTGVVTTFGKVEDYTFEAGFHTKLPWNTVTEMDNRVQKSTVDLSCFSSDIQEVNMKYTLNYQIDKSNAQEIYKTIGVDYYGTIIEPTIKECVKVATAKFTAEQLVQTRTQLATDIEELLVQQLEAYNIKVASTAIEDIDFTDSFTNAVESKQVAEQKKKQAEIEQAQAIKQAEADATVAKTKAEADAAVKKIEAEMAAEIATIQANAAEYTGRKEAAVVLNRLAGINGWNVVLDTDTNLYKLVKSDGTDVTEAERAIGVQKLIEYYYTQSWDGKLPETYVGDDSVSSILIGNN